ncbi:MAG: hypothetical protein LBE99_00205 [Puniceicoccales bacterium]|nr:hypothetical protein [Puniceicoccales bacterium]
MNKFIKTSLVTVGLMGAITLNAWHCADCQMEHRGRVCPVTGRTSDGSRHDGWEQDVDADDREAIIKYLIEQRQTYAQPQKEDPNPGRPKPSINPVVGRMLDGNSIYDMDGNYGTEDGRQVKKIAGRWLYSISHDIWSDGVDKIFDPKGQPIESVGQLANGHLVYKVHSRLSTARGYFEYFATGYPEEKDLKIAVVQLLHGRFVYGHSYSKTRACIKGAYFDGRQWIDKKTGQTYNTEEDIP